MSRFPSAPTTWVPFQLFELDEAWLDKMHYRLAKGWENELDKIERDRDRPPDLHQQIRETLDLMERVLKVQCLMRKAYPKRSRAERRRRKNAR